MTFLFILLHFHGAAAIIYHVHDYYNTSTIQKNNPKCTDLWDGLNCDIPICYPENGELFEQKCMCNYNEYISGTHCEKVECHNGQLINSTHCACPVGLYASRGQFCQEYVYMRSIKTFGFLCLMLSCVFCYSLYEYTIERFCSNTINKEVEHGQTATLVRPRPPNNRCETVTPAVNTQTEPEIRIVERVVERVVYRDVSDAPPTYETAVDPVNRQRCESQSDSANLPAYETVVEGANLQNYATAIIIDEPPKYTV
uniref:EGF-like domain-containing protein n=1 Tax=Panagrellus redivivus TaxID=6233 RepID=A0A7E4VAU8_PANRE